ncbi:hypothetical protein DFH29DRAFT_1001516 [Suillus ampliporus]|nr:hypothetical protein DFH29DRAFT_1001516 [Suillus ampliporus]
MSTVFKDTLSTSLTQNARANQRSSHPIDNGNNMRPEHEPHEAFDSDLVPVVGSEGASTTQATNKILQPSERKKKLIVTNWLTYLLDSFRQFVVGDPNISLSAQCICQQVIRFVMKPDRQYECEEFCGIWRVEYEELVRFIDETCDFGLKPRLTYLDADSTLLIEMPSAVHEAALVALHTALTFFIESIPFDCQAVNVNILSNIEASDSLVPDMRISFQKMRRTTSKTIISGITETAFLQNRDVLVAKLEDAIEDNLSSLLVIAVVISEDTPYHSPKKGSHTRRALLLDSPKRSSDDFLAATGDLPTLDAPVVVENHTWCSISSIWFKVWVHGDQPIDIYTDDQALVADGYLYPQDSMAPVLAMLDKGVNTIRERLITLCKEIDNNVDVDALQDPTIVFRIRKEDIATKIAGAMCETVYGCYTAWHKKALKAEKRKASPMPLAGPSTKARNKAPPVAIVDGTPAGIRTYRTPLMEGFWENAAPQDKVQEETEEPHHGMHQADGQQIEQRDSSSCLNLGPWKLEVQDKGTTKGAAHSHGSQLEDEYFHSSVLSAEMVSLTVTKYTLATLAHALCVLGALISQTCTYQNWGNLDVTFHCILCHTTLANKLKEKVPYYGFYRDQNRVLPSFLPVQGQLEFSKCSQISTSPVLIIHFKLVDHSTAGSPADMIHLFLKPYFPYDGLRLLDVIFNFSTARKIKAYSEQCTALVNDLEKEEYSLMCIIITTHTDDTHGDLFVGHDKKSNYIAASVTQFMNVLLPPWHSVIQRAQESTLFFMGCGAIVNQPDVFRNLRSSVLMYTFSSAVAFTAPHFQPSYTCQLALTYTELVLVERFDIREAFPKILGQSY